MLAGAVLFASLQTNPNKLWSSALTNTSSSLASTLNFLGKPNINGYDLNSTFANKNSTHAAADTSGTTTGSINNQASTLTTKIPILGNTVTVDAITTAVAGSNNPDGYYRINGLANLSQILTQNNGSSAFTDNAAQVEGQWLMLSHTSADSAVAAAQVAQGILLPNSAVGVVVSKLNALNRQYLFTNDPAKAILTNRQDIGSQTINKRSQYHYKFTFQTAHFKQYQAAVTAALGSNTSAVASIEHQLGLDTLVSALASVKGTPTADVWVDQGTTTISKIHIPIAAGINNYAETGLSYTGGSLYPFYVSLSGDANNVTTLNTYSLSVNTSGGGYTYGYSLANKNSQGTQTNTASTTLLPRSSALSISIPTQTKDYETYATPLNAALGGLFPSQN